MKQEIAIEYGCGNHKNHIKKPLSNLFYSDICSKLVCRHPECSFEEFESYYCPFLLVNMPSKEANMYQNCSSRCYKCIECGNILSTFYDEKILKKYFFACTHCRWDSIDMGLMEEEIEMLHMAPIQMERESIFEEIFHTLTSYYSTNTNTTSTPGITGSTHMNTGMIHTHVGGINMNMMMTNSNSSSTSSLLETMKEIQREQQMKKFKAQRMLEMGHYKFDQAMEQIHLKDQWLLDQRHQHTWTPLSKQLEKFPLFVPEKKEPEQNLKEFYSTICMMDGTIAPLAQRFENPLEQYRTPHRLVPSRVPLRVKRTWRCVEAMKTKNSAGILVKPQISPLSGDSSLPIPTPWFKKATLGIHHVPIVTFQELPSRIETTTSRAYVVLMIENPIDEMIKIRLIPPEDQNCPTKYTAEVSFFRLCLT
jgi:dynactin-4